MRELTYSELEEIDGGAWVIVGAVATVIGTAVLIYTVFFDDESSETSHAGVKINSDGTIEYDCPGGFTRDYWDDGTPAFDQCLP